jgi:hypothetical protein
MADESKNSLSTTRRPLIGSKPVSTLSVEQQADAFLKKVRELGSSQAALQPQTTQARGRLIFAMDATSSRQPTWDMAVELQGEMFRAASGLEVKLVYFRGASECRQSPWKSDPDQLSYLMRKVSCQAGYTQIGKVLTLARELAAEESAKALVYVGDSMEEKLDILCGRAAEAGIPIFVFHEFHGEEMAEQVSVNPQTERAFREIARTSNGAYCRFDAGAADTLRQLLGAVAVYATGGVSALETHVSKSPTIAAEPVHLLLTQLKK